MSEEVSAYSTIIFCTVIIRITAGSAVSSLDCVLTVLPRKQDTPCNETLIKEGK